MPMPTGMAPKAPGASAPGGGPNMPQARWGCGGTCGAKKGAGPGCTSGGPTPGYPWTPEGGAPKRGAGAEAPGPSGAANMEGVPWAGGAAPEGAAGAPPKTGGGAAAEPLAEAPNCGESGGCALRGGGGMTKPPVFAGGGTSTPLAFLGGGTAKPVALGTNALFAVLVPRKAAAAFSMPFCFSRAFSAPISSNPGRGISQTPHS
mmetsp:Transcript_74994/g.231647  ORF Transcript_74994/g.231647 Transcript_74994/m.231647 type:complete len:204 (+) Transcript_74994:964-1575(+)